MDWNVVAGPDVRKESGHHFWLSRHQLARSHLTSSCSLRAPFLMEAPLATRGHERRLEQSSFAQLGMVWDPYIVLKKRQKHQEWHSLRRGSVGLRLLGQEQGIALLPLFVFTVSLCFTTQFSEYRSFGISHSPIKLINWTSGGMAFVSPRGKHAKTEASAKRMCWVRHWFLLSVKMSTVDSTTA